VIILGVHRESLSAIVDPIKSRIPNRRQSLSHPLWLRLGSDAFALCDRGWCPLLVDLIYQEWSEGPADDEASAVLPIELLKGVKNGFADF
jgi:hypothetical protein